MRLVSRGPLVAARITYGPAIDPVTGETLDRSWLWSAEVNGELVAQPSPDPEAAQVFRIWHSGDPCTEAEFHYRLDLKTWAEIHAPGAPEANPREAIDLTTLPSLF
jgi:hypothetical protein